MYIRIFHKLICSTFWSLPCFIHSALHLKKFLWLSCGILGLKPKKEEEEEEEE